MPKTKRKAKGPIRVLKHIRTLVEVIHLFQQRSEDEVSSSNVMSFAVECYYDEDDTANQALLTRFLSIFKKSMSIGSLSKDYFMNEVVKPHFARDFRLAQAIALGRGDPDTRLRHSLSSFRPTRNINATLVQYTNLQFPYVPRSKRDST